MVRDFLAKLSSASPFHRRGGRPDRVSILVPFLIISFGLGVLTWRSYHLSAKMEESATTLAGKNASGAAANLYDPYDAFRREIGVSDFEVELRLALQKVDTLKQTIETSRVEAATEAAKEDQFRRQKDASPATRVSTQSVSNSDQIQLAALRSTLATDDFR